MVKGLSRRVIVVDSPDPHIFEQAIFIVRNDAAVGSGGVTSQQVVDRRPGGGCACPRGWRPFWAARSSARCGFWPC